MVERHIPLNHINWPIQTMIPRKFLIVAIVAFFFVAGTAADFAGLPAGVLERRLLTPVREPTGACSFAPVAGGQQTYAFLTTQQGLLLLYNGTGFRQVADLGSRSRIPLSYEGESGLLACVADSNFVWLFYGTTNAYVVSRIPFRLSPTPVVRLGQEKRLLTLPRVASYHVGGSLAWFTERGRRSLLVGRGDDARCDYGGTECAQLLNVSDPRTYGKVLRSEFTSGDLGRPRADTGRIPGE
jgi:hypothetical protein